MMIDDDGDDDDDDDDDNNEDEDDDDDDLAQACPYYFGPALVNVMTALGALVAGHSEVQEQRQ